MHILIIDDTPDHHQLCMDYLQSEGDHFQFSHAYTGEQGLALYAREAIDCVLLAHHLPDMDGLKVLRWLARDTVSLPVIMIAMDGSETIAVTAAKFAAQDYVPKKMITASALKRVVERARSRAEIMQKMEQYRTELERSNYDLEQFSTIVAHDLKAPLRAVTQHLSLLKNKNAGKLDERSMRSLEFAVDGAERMRALIDALFTYARLGFSEPNMRRVSLQTLLTTATRDLAAEIEECSAHITHGPLPEVVGDAVLLGQLLQNLLANALKYCAETPHIHVSALLDGDYWRISVRDNGIGISVAQHEKIFAIFRRLHQEEDFPGIGLGLAVCQRIAQQHGGVITVASELDKGSVFTFTLPSIASATVPAQVAYAS